MIKRLFEKYKNNKKTLSIFVIIVLFVGFSHITPVKAIGTGDLGMSYGVQTQLSSTDPRLVIARIIQITLGFLAIISILLIMYSGFVWMNAKGDEAQIEKAKSTLKNAVIGLIIILASFGITTFILNAIVNATNGGGSGGGGSGPSPAPPSPSANISWTSCDSDGDITNGVCDLSSACMTGTYCDFASGCYCLNKKGAGETCGNIDNNGVCDAHNEQCISDDCNVNTCLCNPTPIITSVTPYGGFCVDDVNVPCNNDNDCSSGKCDLTTPNGAIGNFISIKGEYFGDGSGLSKVEFIDKNGKNQAGDVVSVNPKCDGAWTDTEIIVVLTAGNGTDDATTSIKVIRSDGKEDTTNNDKGNIIPDLVINNIVRAGICKLDPNNAKAGKDINVSGNNFVLNSKFYFGNYNNKVEAENFTYNSASDGTANIPLINKGTTTSFIVNNVNGIDILSNYFNFTKNAEDNSAPYISYFSPLAGSIGQYVTIYGGGFENFKGSNSSVKFVNGNTEIEANYVFPQVCSDSVWSNNQIIVKVPKGVDYNNDGVYDESYKISVQIGFLDPVQSMKNFNASSSMELLPGLCKMIPTFGPNNTPIDIWGEYFGDNHGSIKFYFDKIYNDSSDKITFWGDDSTYTDGAQKITTQVHEKASSGLIRARKKNKTGDNNFGNGLHFEVGRCDQEVNPNDACIDNGGVCCLSGYRQGSCVSNITDCYSVADSSVYEWEFTTNFSGSDYGSCEEYHIAEEKCSNDKFCPNSPGNCSLDKDGNVSIGNSCDCNNYGNCALDNCNYDSSIDSCVYQNVGVDVACNISKVVKDINGDDVTAYCADNGDWYFEESGSCPSGWSKNVDGDCATSSPACNACVDGSCINKDKNNPEDGVCVAKQNICNGGICNANKKCEVHTNEICECCCRMDAKESDCCTFVDPYTNVSKTLSCEGACGQYPLDNDGFGRCTGCTVKDNNGNIDQGASDNACNCAKASGKYCDTSMAGGKGVCMECGGLDMDLCTKHSESCCVDAMQNNLCVGGSGDTTLDDSGNNIGYCGYYQCTQIQTENGNKYNGACSDKKTKGGEGLTLFSSLDECNLKCSSDTGNGVEKSCYNRDDSSCSINCTYPNYCIGKNGGIFNQAVQGDDDTCKCCCNPNASTDECSEINPNMKCTPNMGDCTGNERGLCCGCKSDYDCSEDPTTVGCGKDTCCHHRPNVDSVEPNNNATDVCTNIQIKAIFDTQMDEASLKDNFILLGQFNNSCPVGTKYLTSLDQSSYSKWSGILDIFSNQAKASGNIYCKVNGSIYSEYNPDDKKTSLIFNISDLLATSTEYFAIIKGDEGLNSKSGVLSDYKIGMKGSNNTSQTKFNGIEYSNAYIWEFKTIGGQNNKGACEVDHVDITPDSYLFKTTKDDLNENDTNPADSSYDSVSSEGKDSDKVFKAEVKNVDDETLSPISGVYDWTWNWNISDNNVIKFEDGAGDTKDELISAVSTVTEGKSDLTANITINNALYGTSSMVFSSTAKVWVFICNNPWPAYKYSTSTGVYTWAPWQDSTTCVDSSGASSVCDNMNYELYYCKDNKSDDDKVKQDDLSTIGNGSTRGEYKPLVCSDVIGDCVGKVAGDNCHYEESSKGYCNKGLCSDFIGDCTGINDGELCKYSGTCNLELKIKKETYFFRKTDGAISDINLAPPTSGSTGQSINLSWINTSGNYKYFTIYYGKNSENYTDKINYVNNSPYTINNLDKNTKYFFRIGGNTADGIEKLSNEESIITNDTTPPSNFSSDLKVSAGDKKVYLEWKAPSDNDLTYFKVKWVAVSGNDCSGVNSYGDSSDLLAKNIEDYKIKNLTNNVHYCVAVVAGDDSGNEVVAGPKYVVPQFGTKITACPVGNAPNYQEGGKIGNGACMLTQDLVDTIVNDIDLKNATCTPIFGDLLGGEEYKCRVELDKYELPAGWKNGVSSSKTSCIDNGNYTVKLKDGEELVNNGDAGAKKEKEYLEFSFNPLINNSGNCTTSIEYSLTDTKKTYTSSADLPLLIKANPDITNIDGFTTNAKRVGDIVLVNANITVGPDYILDTNNISIQDKDGNVVGIMNKVGVDKFSTTFTIGSVTEYYIHAFAYNKSTSKTTESVAKIELGNILNNIVVSNNVGGSSGGASGNNSANNSSSTIIYSSKPYEDILFSSDKNGNLTSISSYPNNADDKVDVMIVLDNFSNVYSGEAELTADWKNRISNIIGNVGYGIISRSPFSSNSNKFKWYVVSVDSGENCYSSYCTSDYANKIDVISKDANGNYFNIGANWADNVIVLSDSPYYGYAYRENGWLFASGASESYSIMSIPNFGNLNYSLMAFKFSDNDYALTFAMSQDYCNTNTSKFNGVPVCSDTGKFQKITDFDPDNSNTVGSADLGLAYMFDFNGNITSINDFISNGKIKYDYVFIYNNGESYNAHYPIENIVPSLVVSHEFGHAFGLLIDEYITGDYLSDAEPNCSKTNTATFNIKGCNKSSWYRSSNNSIMKELSINGNGNSFNAVSQNWMSGVLDCFGGSCSNRCNICKINTHYFDKNSVVDCNSCP